jgi:hypothetical protein
MDLEELYLEVVEDSEAKDEIISDLKEELHILRKAERDAAMMKVRFAYTQ